MDNETIQEEKFRFVFKCPNCDTPFDVRELIEVKKFSGTS